MKHDDDDAATAATVEHNDGVATTATSAVHQEAQASRRGLLALFGAFGAISLAACGGRDSRPEDDSLQRSEQGMLGPSSNDDNFFPALYTYPGNLVQNGGSWQGEYPRLVYVFGFASPGDGGEGLYIWDPDSLTAPDASTHAPSGVLVVQPNPMPSTSKGRFRRVVDGPVNVRWFGAGRGLAGVSDDAPIQHAMDAATEIYFPPGTYTLTAGVLTSRDNVCLRGGPGALIIWDPPTPTPDYACAVAVYRNSGTERVQRPVISGLSFLARGGPNGNSGSIIQVNNCEQALIENVRIQWDSSIQSKPSQLDGITFAMGTSGSICNCVVDGIPKVGIYLSGSGTSNIRVADCEVMRANGQIGGAGISVAATDVQISNCHCHDNNFGIVLAGVGTGQAPIGMAKRVRVTGCEFAKNHVHGISIGSTFPNFSPYDIQLHGVSCVENGSNGINIDAGYSVLVADAKVMGNGVCGIAVAGSGNGGPTQGVDIIDCVVEGNSRNDATTAPGIGIRCVNDITIRGGSVRQAGTQLLGIQFLFGAGANSNIRIHDVDVDNAVLQNAFVVTWPNAPEAASGHFQIAHAGNPMASTFAAPVGSQLIDTATGNVYLKVSGDSGPTGWKRLAFAS
ncbi:MAG: right-handed parallel beta-helix repeat-containing protein [Deltaproteobacteria bacterium]|nr:right-handed parallel beta-helix repeat-containing protein [Deltaproteobacteria bacterium]